MGLGQTIVMQNHDALLLSVPKAGLLEHAAALNTAMTYPIAIKGQELTIPVDLKWGENWGELEDLKLD